MAVEMNTKEAWLTAIHESGHIVACLASGGQVRAVSIVPDAECMGRTTLVGGIRQFIRLAGPWSEGRYLWELSPGVASFDDQIDCALWRCPSDGGRRLIADRTWKQLADELEGLWELICDVAQMLIDGADIAALTEAVDAELQADETAVS